MATMTATADCSSENLYVRYIAKRIAMSAGGGNTNALSWLVAEDSVPWYRVNPGSEALDVHPSATIATRPEATSATICHPVSACRSAHTVFQSSSLGSSTNSE